MILRCEVLHTSLVLILSVIVMAAGTITVFDVSHELPGSTAMETLRLRTLQQPSMTQLQLESLLRYTHLPPSGTERLPDRSELPAVLQRIVIRGGKDGIAWAAWRRRIDVHFVLAELAFDLSRECGRPTLRVKSYDESGKIFETVTWTETSPDEWRRHAH